jgi:protein-S-isoprenylcysteine O-methyltransferase Ste14
MNGRFGKKLVSLGVVGLFLVAALEVVIMISPFAFFFYSVFNPIFQLLSQSSLAGWATRFFLPHMILPPTLFLKSLRVLGSIFFVLGLGIFLVCALQVYLGKIFKSGIASRGLYRYIRHPQYLALGIWGVGMAILWPRFIVLVTLAIMFSLYFFLARDEEKRMVSKFGDSYVSYMATTGMVFPRFIERPLAAFFSRVIPQSALKYVAVPAIILALVMGRGFLLRSITLHSLALSSKNNLTTVPILPEDGSMAEQVVNELVARSASGEIAFLDKDKNYLGYVMPVDYIMQGMIADTGGHSHLFKHHHTFALITDWVLHPFDHLRRPPAAHMAALTGMDPQLARRHHCPLEIQQDGLECEACPFRRVILVEVDGEPHSRPGVFSLQGKRTPVGYVDINTQTGAIIAARKVGSGTAWKDIPTPEI